MSELAVLLPVLLVMLIVGVDFGRLVYSNQVLVDLTREAANLVSRGTTADDVFKAGFLTAGELDIINDGGIIVSEVRRKAQNDATPWIFDQDSRGVLNAASRVGKLNAKATIPNVPTLQANVTVIAVEILHPFEPIFNLAPFGLDLYPTTLYDVAYF
jgi:Flp pilus assembly protein TadG